jgi:hypothetical protein
MAPDLASLRALSEPIIEQDWPTPTCPHCDRGLIVFAPSDTHMSLQPWSDHERDGWDPEDVEGVFAVLGTCSAARCGGRVMISGTFRVRSQERRHAGDPGHVYVFSVLQAAPAFGLISPPLALPESIRGSIRRAERLLLPDRASAAGALRAAVERLLTEQGIPGRTPAGGFKTADNRITEWEAAGGPPQVIELLRAVKWIGNHGSHEEPDLTVDDVLETVELLAHALDLVYDDRGERLSVRAAAVNARKGPLRPTTQLPLQ